MNEKTTKQHLSDKVLTFEDKVKNHWTSDRLRKLCGNHKYPIIPTNAPQLLRTLGLLNQDGSMSADSVRKFTQINHLFNQLRTQLEDLNQRHQLVRVVDLGCGSAFLTFLLTWAYRDLWKHPALLIGVDDNKSLIAKNQNNAEKLQWSESLKFATNPIASFDWITAFKEHADPQKDEKSIRPHVVVALHACDTATDDAIALGINAKSDFIAVAPCCQAELAKYWKQLGDSSKSDVFNPMYRNPHLRREIAAPMTDLLRVLLLRSRGYEVTTLEFTMSHATPKNTLLLATRRGNYHKDSLKEYEDLKAALGGMAISLEQKIHSA